MDTSTRTFFRTISVSVLACSLALPSSVALAAPSPATRSPEATTDEEPTARSRALFDKGLDAYEVNDFAGAAEYWTEAYDLMPQTSELAATRRVLGFDLAQTQMRAYNVDRDRARMTAAKPLLEEYVAWVDRPGHTMDEGEQQDRQRAIELLDRIAAESPPAPVAPVPRPTPEADEPPPAAPQPDGKGLLIGGGVALGGSVASIVAVFAMRSRGRAAEDRFNAASERFAADPSVGQSEIDAAERDGKRANIGLLTSMTAAVVLGVAGATMIGIGAHRRKRHISASAGLTPTSASASLSFRF